MQVEPYSCPEPCLAFLFALMSFTKVRNGTRIEYLGPRTEGKSFPQTWVLMQDSKEFRLAYSQDTLGQPHLH